MFRTLVFSQTRESDRLLQQSFETVYSNPDEAIKVAQHLIKSSEDLNQKADAFLLSALAHYTKGEYDLSLTDAFEARNLSSRQKTAETFNKSTILLAEILKFLQLNGEAERYLSELPDKNKLIYYKKSFDENNQSGLWEAEYLKDFGDSYFQEKKNDSAIIILEKALDVAEKINNPFLQVEIHQKLSASFLVLDNKKKYHEHNQKALSLSNLTTRIENNSANMAHQLISQERENRLIDTKAKYMNILLVLLGVIVLGILTQTILTIRNRNKIKIYTALLKYLNKGVEKEAETELIVETVVSENEGHRPTTLLKESEDQILVGLRKFESSKRFTSKDMSLGMLAAQLNTNTKYLSEVINRHKQKNFNSYINELRINYITEKIKTEPNYLNYKVSYLAEECGFSSHSTFTTVFKSVVGVSPIIFVDFVKKEITEEKEMAVQ